MGRNTKLTPERMTRIIASLQNGDPIEVACAHGGIAKSTFYNWIDRGEAEAGSTIDPDDYTAKQLRAMAKTRGVDLAGATTKAAIADRINNTQSIFVDFLDAQKSAIANAETYALAQAVRTGNEDWRFWMTYLERRWPQRWARRTRLEDEVEDLETIGSGSTEEAERMLEEGREIRVKMLGTGTDN